MWLQKKMLKDKVVLITGASRGIGKAIALEFAKQNAKVIINYNDSFEEAERTLLEVRKDCPSAISIKADVSRSKEVEEMFVVIKNNFGGIDILINNAGILKDNLIVNTSEEEWDKVINNNLKGTFNCLKEAAKLMMLKGGKIINITSIVGVYGNPGQAAYSASKAGIIGLTKTAAKELGEVGITINAIAPGLTETEMIGHLKQEQRTKLINQTAMKRIGMPEEIAKVALFLASDWASYVNGQIICVDGGMMM